MQRSNFSVALTRKKNRSTYIYYQSHTGNQNRQQPTFPNHRNPQSVDKSERTVQNMLCQLTVPVNNIIRRSCGNQPATENCFRRSEVSDFWPGAPDLVASQEERWIFPSPRAFATQEDIKYYFKILLFAALKQVGPNSCRTFHLWWA